MDELDELLLVARPRTSADDQGVQAELAALARDAHESERPSRARRSVVAIATTAALAFGGVGVAAAAPAFSDLFGWDEGVDRVEALPERGEECYLGMVIVPESEFGRDDPSYLAAREALLELDLDELDLAGAQAGFERANADWAEQPAMTREALVKVTAMKQVIDASVKSRGLDVTAFSLKMGNACGGEVVP